MDSSAWIEDFIDGPNAAFFASATENIDRLVVPSLSLRLRCIAGVHHKAKAGV